MEFITKSARETQELGKKIAADLISGKIKNHKGAVVLALSGDLGSGKTTFIQGFATGLGVSQRVISPTFIVVRKYDLPRKDKSQIIKYLYHIDLYRFDENITKELNNLGLNEIFSDSESVVVIEWADKAKDFIPKDSLPINFLYEGDRRRVAFNK